VRTSEIWQNQRFGTEKKQTVNYRVPCDVRPWSEEVFNLISKKKLESDDVVRSTWLQHEVRDAEFRVLCMRYLVICY